MKKIAILQSNYLPWKGVFDMINQVDVFVFLEDAQYTKNDWRNRNKIMTYKGEPCWISVPIKNTIHHTQFKIHEAMIGTNSAWQRKHHASFTLNYSKARFFKEYKYIIDNIYLNKKWDKLSDLNIYCIKEISAILGIKTAFVNSCDLGCSGIKDDKLINICKSLGADSYLSGLAAKAYIVPDKFKNNNITLEYIKYEYPEYPQLGNKFEHGVTILDLVFNCGSNAYKYIFKKERENV